jgi:leader peptidase (prepilin peptidase)/N-methyltransferase
LAGLFGLCVGSFANVFLARYPQGESLFWPSSRCPQCGHPIRWWHNVPVLGWLWLGGRCFDCKQPISWRYPVMEALFGLLAWAWVGHFGTQAYSLYLGGFCLALLLIAAMDWQTLHIFDVCTYPLAACGVFGSVFFPWAYGGLWWHSVAAMAAMAACMGLLAWGGKLYAKRDALGGGDIKLMIAAAGFLGWPVAWSALLLGIFLGLPIMMLYQRLNKLGWREPAPFGPALALGCGLAAWDLAGGGLILHTFDPFF